MSSKQQTIKEEGDKTSVDRGKVYAKLEPSKKPAFLEMYLNVKKDGHGKTLKPLLAEYTREMQERTSHWCRIRGKLVLRREAAFIERHFVARLWWCMWLDSWHARTPTRTATITKRLNAARRC